MTTLQLLINEIQNTLNYNYDDAEVYAAHLKNLALKEYQIINTAYNHFTTEKKSDNI